MGWDSPSHLLIILIVLILLFGSAKLPKLARSLGESMRIFKKEAQGVHKAEEANAQAPVQGTVQQPLPPPAAQQPAPGVTQPTAAAAPEPQRTDQAG